MAIPKSFPSRLEDVTIVGGGIVGVCCALSLIETGLGVTLIDRNDPGRGTSFGNAGIVSPWSIVPQAVPGIWKKLPGMILRPDGPAGISLPHAIRYLPWLLRFLRATRPDRVRHTSDAMYILCRDSISLYRQHLAGTGKEGLIRDSIYVHAFRDAAQAKVDSIGNVLRTAKGAELERVGPEALRRLEPALSKDFKAAILIKGQARALDPGQIVATLAEKFRKLGGTITRAEVSALNKKPDGTWSVVTDHGEAPAHKVVLAAGAWSARLLRPLGVRVPLAAERGYHVCFPDANIALNNSVMDAENHIVGSSMAPGLRFAGIAEFAGTETPARQRHIKNLLSCAKSMVPDLDVSTYTDWMGVRPSFPDSIPLIENVPNCEGLIAAFGHSHYGLMMAPKTGEIVAGLANETNMNIDLSAFRSVRF